MTRVSGGRQDSVRIARGRYSSYATAFRPRELALVPRPEAANRPTFIAHVLQPGPQKCRRELMDNVIVEYVGVVAT